MTKARELGFPQTGIAEALCKAIAWYRAEEYITNKKLKAGENEYE